MSAAAPARVSVCFPAYNEEASVRAAVEEADELLAASGLDYEILVCDDGSTDATPAIVDALARERPRVRALHNAPNRGIRATFERLYAEAALDWVFLNAVDRQWDTRVLFELLARAPGHDVVVAARRRKPYGPLRAVVSWGFNWLPRLLFGVDTVDAGAVKLVRREIIARHPVISRSPFSEAERLIRIARAGGRIGVVRVDVRPRQAGQARGVSPRLVLQALADVARVRWALCVESRPSRRSQAR